MVTFFPDIRLVLFIILFLFGLQTEGLLYGAELPGLEYAPGENQQEQNQEITQETLKIRVDVAQVTVDVTVTGTPVSELQLEDFTVYDNGVAQNVSHFSRDKIPLAVALLIDSSGSEIPYLPALKIAALSALRRLRPEDQVALFLFDTNSAKLSDLTEDQLMIGKKINALTINERRGTNIFDTIYDAAHYLARNAPNRRRAIVLVSDNCHTVSGQHDADDAQVEMLEASATLYGIKTAGNNPIEIEDICVESSDQVKSIASETGGEILDVSAPTSLQAALEKITSNLRLQYTLGFSPSNLGEEGSFHKLTVKIEAKDRCPGCQLLARSGYYTGITAPLPPQDDIPLKLNVSADRTDQLLVQRLILTAGTAELDLTDIPFTVKTFKQTDPMDQPQLKIDLQIDFSRIELAIVKNSRPCKLHIVVLYADEKGKILGSDWKKLEGLLSEETYNQIRERGILVSTTIPLESKKQILKVVVYDEENDRVGSKLIRLDKKGDEGNDRVDSNSIRLDDTGKNNHIRVLVDASKDEAWWNTQNNKHRGKAAADSMRARGWEVVELPRGKVINPELFKGFDIVIRPTVRGIPYAQSEEIAYKIAVAAGVKLLSIGFLDYQTLPEKVLKALREK
jgi:Ca-activated chloride channel homolog